MWKFSVSSLCKPNPTLPSFGLPTVLSLWTEFGPLHESDLAPELQILRAFSLFLTGFWKHKNRLSTEIVLGCLSSHSDYSNIPLRHRSSIRSAPGVVRIVWNQLLNYTVRRDLKSSQKNAQKLCGMTGKLGMGEVQFQFRCTQCKHLHLSSFSRLHYSSGDSVKSPRD